MKNLLRSWRDSLGLLKPQTLWLFFQVTLKTFFTSYINILKYWIIIFLGAFIAFLRWPEIAPWLFPVLFFLWIFSWVIVTRPSLGLKNGEYAVINLIYLPFFFITYVISCFLPLELLYLITPFIFFLLFFITDSGFKSNELLRTLWRAFKLSLNNAPLYGLLALVAYGGTQFLCCSDFWLHIFFEVIALPFYITLISRVHCSAIHKEYQEYYEGC